MHDEYIRDHNNRLIGILDYSTTGRVVIRDENSRYLGCYYEDLNKTYDENSRYIGEGNQLMRLLR